MNKYSIDNLEDNYVKYLYEKIPILQKKINKMLNYYN